MQIKLSNCLTISPVGYTPSKREYKAVAVYWYGMLAALIYYVPINRLYDVELWKRIGLLYSSGW